ncbi:MAG: DnaJ domain-containing protein [Nitrosopumilaceae archaeon]
MNEYQAYQTLNINSNSTFNDVKYAYRKLALELHPDKNSNEKDGKKFKEVTIAYHILKNNHKKNNSNITNSEEKDNSTQTKTRKDFRKKKSEWGADPKEKTPDEDWGRFTKDFEEANPDFWKKYEAEFWKKYEARINNDNGFGKKSKEEEKSEPEINFSVNVDPSLCIGCCSCETIAPEVFVVDKLSKMNPKSKVFNQRGARFNKVMNAAETCPTKAINVDDKDLKKRIYPW